MEISRKVLLHCLLQSNSRKKSSKVQLKLSGFLCFEVGLRLRVYWIIIFLQKMNDEPHNRPSIISLLSCPVLGFPTNRVNGASCLKYEEAPIFWRGMAHIFIHAAMLKMISNGQLKEANCLLGSISNLLLNSTLFLRTNPQMQGSI